MTTYLGRRIHKVELEEVLDPEGLEKEHRIRKVRTLNLGDHVDEHLVAERHLGVEAVGSPERRRLAW